MAKATSGGVTLELTAREAEVVHALLGSLIIGALEVESDAIFNALESAGVCSDDISVEWNDEDSGIKLVEVR